MKKVKPSYVLYQKSKNTALGDEYTEIKESITEWTGERDDSVPIEVYNPCVLIPISIEVTFVQVDLINPGININFHLVRVTQNTADLDPGEFFSNLIPGRSLGPGARVFCFLG